MGEKALLEKDFFGPGEQKRVDKDEIIVKVVNEPKREEKTMGRKKLQETMEVVSVRMEGSLVRRIEKLAVKADIDKARLLRNIIEVEISALEKVDKLGLFTFGVIMRDRAVTLKSWVKMCEKEPENVGTATA